LVRLAMAINVLQALPDNSANIPEQTNSQAIAVNCSFFLL